MDGALKIKRSVVSALMLTASLVAGCATSGDPGALWPSLGGIANPGIGQQSGSSARAAFDASSDSGRLEKLFKRRMSEDTRSDFTIGPGDVIEITVPAIEALKDRTVRVSAKNTVSLPLLGVIRTAGMTEQVFRETLKQRLGKYMYDPEVDVFVKEYQSRQVAVAGAVKSPGLYTLASHADTILSMISRAGGRTDNAASFILFIPAAADPGSRAATADALQRAALSGYGRRSHRRESDRLEVSGRAAPERARPVGTSAKARDVAHDGKAVQSGERSIAQMFAAADPISIDLTSFERKSYLNMPARPGDVIIVPSAGEVMVQGWVETAGAFKITPGMTVLGAVTAAGGEQFSSSALVLREGGDGGKMKLLVNLAKVEKGEQQDVAVRSGDVIIVQRSLTGAVPYLGYTLFNKIGTYLPLPAF